MDSNIIEITVTGSTGSGKSEVCEVIANALREYYKTSKETINVAGDVNVGAIKDAKTTGQTAKSAIFVLREQNRPVVKTEQKRQY